MKICSILLIFLSWGRTVSIIIGYDSGSNRSNIRTISLLEVGDYCGAYSHISVVTNGEAQYLKEIWHETCKSLHATGTYKASENLIISDILLNETTNRGVTFAGTIKIRAFTQETTVGFKSDKICLKSGLTCTLSQTSRIDEEGGYTFGDPLPRDVCNLKEYEMLYEGKAIKIPDNSTNEILFSLT